MVTEPMCAAGSRKARPPRQRPPFLTLMRFRKAGGCRRRMPNPEPVVDLAEGRARALAAYASRSF